MWWVRLHRVTAWCRWSSRLGPPDPPASIPARRPWQLYGCAPAAPRTTTEPPLAQRMGAVVAQDEGDKQMATSRWRQGVRVPERVSGFGSRLPSQVEAPLLVDDVDTPPRRVTCHGTSAGGPLWERSSNHAASTARPSHHRRSVAAKQGGRKTEALDVAPSSPRCTLPLGRARGGSRSPAGCSGKGSAASDVFGSRLPLPSPLPRSKSKLMRDHLGRLQIVRGDALIVGQGNGPAPCPKSGHPKQCFRSPCGGILRTRRHCPSCFDANLSRFQQISLPSDQIEYSLILMGFFSVYDRSA